MGLSLWLRQQRICLKCRRPRFDPWVGKIPWRRKWQPTPGLLPGKSHRQRNLVDYSPWGHKESDTTEWFHFLSLSILIWVKFCLCNSLLTLHYNKNWIFHSKGKVCLIYWWTWIPSASASNIEQIEKETWYQTEFQNNSFIVAKSWLENSA